MTMDDVVEVRQTLELPERQRDDLALLVAGFSYREIAELTGGRTFTNVSKRLATARDPFRYWRRFATVARASPSA